MIAYFDRFVITMTSAQAESVSHSGRCDDDVAFLLTLPVIIRQLKKISDEDLSLTLKEYGAWDEIELKDRKANEARIIWIAGGNITEEKKCLQ
jgi:hypothetical protein